ncbi:MAG: hypothetical protein RJA70_2104 [Pseudomonadota bacterium]|jgi:hypothetical protein
MRANFPAPLDKTVAAGALLERGSATRCIFDSAFRGVAAAGDYNGLRVTRLNLSIYDGDEPGAETAIECLSSK